MAPRALSVVHQRDAAGGVFTEELIARDWEHDEWHIAEGGPPPAEPSSYDAVLTYGGSMNAHEEERFAWLAREKAVLRELLDSGTPLLGVCLGSQLLADAAGAPVARAPEPEIGWLDVEITDDGRGDPVLGPMAPAFNAFQWHSYASPLPPGAVALARSPVCLQAFRLGARAYGIQFHAEVSRADALRWTTDYHADPDAVRMGIDPDALAAEIADRIGAWNAKGRALCGRFLETAAAEAG